MLQPGHGQGKCPSRNEYEDEDESLGGVEYGTPLELEEEEVVSECASEFEEEEREPEGGELEVELDEAETTVRWVGLWPDEEN